MHLRHRLPRKFILSQLLGCRTRLLYTQAHIFVPELRTRFPYRWLLDSCQCSACVHPSTRQKLHRSSDLLYNEHPKDIAFTNGELRITWSPRNASEPVHKSVYALDWLGHYVNDERRKTFHREVDRVTWSSSQLCNSPNLFMDYTHLRNNNNSTILLQAITQLLKFGIIFVQRVPTEPTDDERCELRQLAAKFGRIRNTFYGEVWNVKNVRDSTNIAYTNLDLGLHMDLLYFQHPPRYQILHSLRNCVQGGTSIFVDAIYAAQKLRTISPASFDLLRQTQVPYHYVNDGHHLHHAHPVISLSRLNSPATIEYINYSPPFQAPLRVETPAEFYNALRQFADLLEQDRYEYTLQEGDAVIFDNRRVLHARTAFQDVGRALQGETSRWLKGCYLEADDVLDRGRILMRDY